ncbi:27397_t:CDS:2, partial [Racocetra persica]
EFPCDKWFPCNKMIKYIVEDGREKCTVKYSELYKDCWRSSGDSLKCFDILKRLEEINTNDIIPDGSDECRQTSSESDDFEYGEFIIQNVDIGGVLMISHKDGQSLSQDIEILKTQIYWTYDHINNGIPNVFNKIPFSNHFTLKVEQKDDEQRDDEQKIVTGQQLMTLMDDLCLIPHIAGFDDKDLNACKDLNTWALNLPKIIYVIGLTIQSPNIRHGQRAVVDFIKIPEVYTLNTSYMHLRQPASKRKAFTLTHRIKLNTAIRIPFLSKKTTDDNFHPLFDSQPTSEIHCFITSEKIKLVIDVDKVEASVDLKNAVDKALEDDFPFQSLKKVFDKFGHLWPQIIILGWSLSRIYNYTTNNNEPRSDYKLFLNTNDRIVLQEQILGKFNDWSKLTNGLNIFFFDPCGLFVEKEKLHFLLMNHLDESLLNSNDEIVKEYENIRNYLNQDKKWIILRHEDLVPLYKVLPKKTQNFIEDIISDKNLIIITDATNIDHENPTYVNIKFVQPLQDNDCKMFEVPLPSQFPVNCNISISVDRLSDSFIFITSFDPENLNKNQVIHASIKDGSKSSLNLNISQNNAKTTRNNELNNVIMRWCLINTNQKDSVTTDVAIKSFSWNDLGDVVKIES